MAKALFHKNQRVFVKPVGTYALVERVIPHWVKDVPEPLRVTYDVGLGREFTGGELVSEAKLHERTGQSERDLGSEEWRIFRMRNRWQDGESSCHHPYPGTFPVVMTDDNDWGGWRVPGAEYDRDPGKIEHQARMIMNAPFMLRQIRAFVKFASEQPQDLPDELAEQAKEFAAILRHIYQIPPKQSDTVAVAAE
ncbi:MAG: hypothetical protein MRY64_04040 [Hyphomonadaceae bacterium]|nr:hypothetical protein [Hyphomonadaceae bacterium]